MTGAKMTNLRFSGGEKGIRTPGGVAPTTVFETAPFDHSGISPLIGSRRHITSKPRGD